MKMLGLRNSYKLAICAVSGMVVLQLYALNSRNVHFERSVKNGSLCKLWSTYFMVR